MSRSSETPPEEDLLDLPLGERPELDRPEDRERRRRAEGGERGRGSGRRSRRKVPVASDARGSRKDPPTPGRSARSSRRIVLGVLVLGALAAATLWWLRPEPARLSAVPSTVDLGSVEVGATTEPVELVLRNAGGSPTEVRRLDLVGPIASELAVAATDCPESILEPGGSCRVRLTGTPRERGARSAVLRIEASGRIVLEVELRVAGAVPRLEMSPPRLDFGSHPVGSVGIPSEIEVTNVGGAPARELSVRRRGGAADDFLVYRDRCTGETLEARASCTVRFGFRPTAVGPRETTLRVEAEGAGPPLEGGLIGIGVRRPVELEVRPERLDLGAVPVGGTSEPTPVEVRNVGEDGIEELDARIEGDSGFELDAAGCAREIEPGGSCRLAVSYRPREPAEAEARLLLGPAGGVSLPLRGRGWTPRLEVRPSRIDFGTEIVGGAGTEQMELRNGGGGPLSPGSPVLEGADAGAFRVDVSSCPPRLAAGAACRPVASFRPGGEGTHEATIRWTGPGGASVRLRGDARTARLEVGRLRLEIDDVSVGRSAGTTAVVVNRSGFAIRLPPSRFVGSRSIRIEEDGCAGREMAPGARCGIRLVFEPEAPGPAGGELVLPAPAQEGRQRISVSANGL